MSPAPALPASTLTGAHTSLDRAQAALCGMGLAVIAREHPTRLALSTPCGDRSFDFLNARANQLVRALRARGLRAGDPVALVCSNRPEFAVACFAALRGGFRLTPINWHFSGAEIAYVVADCGARALLADGRFRSAVEAATRSSTVADAAVRLAIGDPIHGFEAYEAAVAAESPHDLDDPVLGHTMLYTSGTTGQPKGVYREPAASLRRPVASALLKRVGYEAGRDLHLATGPFYHAAPLAFSLQMPLAAGCGVVVMDRFEPERALELIEAYRVTHTHMVPIMFHRLLSLPEEERRRYDTRSLKLVLHGAAPCPLELKRRLIEWLGPVVWEYYAATEGFGSLVGPDEWLLHPGTVGRPEASLVEIRDDQGKVCAAGEPGTIHLRQPEGGGFVYFGDPEKTRRSQSGDFFTLGDVGHLDADGYLFLCDRSADVIISGGVNVYPAEVDGTLLEHPAVGDAATVGAPDDEWGEQVVSFVELKEGWRAAPALAEELAAHCRARIAHYKCPRRIEFVAALPRTDAGKLLRRQLRDRLWQGRDRKI